MSISHELKKLLIYLGLYRWAKWLKTLIKVSGHKEFREQVKFYRWLLPKNSLCFDIGAKTGDKSEALMYAGAKVVAFEPNPLVLPELRARFKQADQCEVVGMALGSAKGVQTFYAREFHAHSGFLPDWESKVIDKFQVSVTTLDAEIDKFGVPYYCKIDVEGWELEVLRGLTHEIPLISFEFHLTSHEIEKTRNCLALLAKFGEGQLNVILGEGTDFLFEEWLSLRDMVKSYPLFPSTPQWSYGNTYGDIFVKRQSLP